MASHSTVLPAVVLLDGPDERVLGMSVRARNLRVAERCGAVVVDPDRLASLGDRAALVVPAHALIDVALFGSVHDGSSGAVAGEAAVIQPGGVLAGPARELARLAADAAARQSLPTRQVNESAVFDVSSGATRRRAARDILRRTAKSTDGVISRRLNRPVSRLVSYVLLALGLNAWHASAITLALGISAAVIAAQPGYVPFLLTGLFFHLASVLDGVDGEMARATLSESRAGARLDTLVDQLTYAAFFAGTTVGWMRETGGRPAIMWSLTAAVALALTLLRAWRFVARHAPNASFVFIDRSVRRAAAGSTSWGLRLAPSLFTLLRRDLFAVVFLVVSLSGIRALVPQLVLAGVVVANLTLTRYRRELAVAAVAEHHGVSTPQPIQLSP